jgi:CRP/FNR family transcriptional regulator, cyclic AMP receptor protein
MSNIVQQLALLKDGSIFSRFTDDQLKIFARKLKIKTFKQNQIIFRQDDTGDSLHIITSGLVHIFTTGEPGQEHSLTVFGKGDFFGELALVDGRPRSASAEAIRPTTTLILQREDFEDLLTNYPAIIASLLLGELASRMRRDNVQAEILAHPSAPQRVALFFIELAKNRGISHTEPIRIELFLNQEKLASMLGMTRESVNRAITGLRRKGLISIEQQTVVIPDLGKLEKSLEQLEQK